MKLHLGTVLPPVWELREFDALTGEAGLIAEEVEVDRGVPKRNIAIEVSCFAQLLQWLRHVRLLGDAHAHLHKGKLAEPVTHARLVRSAPQKVNHESDRLTSSSSRPRSQISVCLVSGSAGNAFNAREHRQAKPSMRERQRRAYFSASGVDVGAMVVGGRRRAEGISEQIFHWHTCPACDRKRLCSIPSANSAGEHRLGKLRRRTSPKTHRR